MRKSVGENPLQQAKERRDLAPSKEAQSGSSALQIQDPSNSRTRTGRGTFINATKQTPANGKSMKVPHENGARNNIYAHPPKRNNGKALPDSIRVSYQYGRSQKDKIHRHAATDTCPEVSDGRMHYSDVVSLQRVQNDSQSVPPHARKPVDETSRLSTTDAPTEAVTQEAAVANYQPSDTREVESCMKPTASKDVDNTYGSNNDLEERTNAVHSAEDDIVRNVVAHINSAFSRGRSDDIVSVVHAEVQNFINEAQNAPIHYSIKEHEKSMDGDVFVIELEAVAMLDDDTLRKRTRCSVYSFELSLPGKTIKSDSINISGEEMEEAMSHYLAQKRDTPLPDEALVIVTDEVIYVEGDDTSNSNKSSDGSLTEEGSARVTSDEEIPDKSQKPVPVKCNGEPQEGDRKALAEHHRGLPALSPNATEEKIPGESKEIILKLHSDDIDQQRLTICESSKDLDIHPDDVVKEVSHEEVDLKEFTPSSNGNGVEEREQQTLRAKTEPAFERCTASTDNDESPQKSRFERSGKVKCVKKRKRLSLWKTIQEDELSLNRIPIPPYIKIIKIDKVKYPNFIIADIVEISD